MMLGYDMIHWSRSMVMNKVSNVRAYTRCRVRMVRGMWMGYDMIYRSWMMGENGVLNRSGMMGMNGVLSVVVGVKKVFGVFNKTMVDRMEYLRMMLPMMIICMKRMFWMAWMRMISVWKKMRYRVFTMFNG